VDNQGLWLRVGAGPLESGASRPATLAGPASPAVGEGLDEAELGDADVIPVDRGWRKGECGPSPGLVACWYPAPSAASRASCTRSRSAPAHGGPGRSRAEPGVRAAGEEERLESLSSQPGQASLGTASHVWKWTAPSLGKRGFGSVVAKHNHTGIAPCLLWMGIKLLLNGICEGFKTQARGRGHTHTHEHTHTDLCTTLFSSEEPLNLVTVFYQ
jgi:hypothetical protein